MSFSVSLFSFFLSFPKVRLVGSEFDLPAASLHCVPVYIIAWDYWPDRIRLTPTFSASRRVLESLKAGKRLPEAQFSNIILAAKGQRSVYGMFEKEKPSAGEKKATPLAS